MQPLGVYHLSPDHPHTRYSSRFPPSYILLILGHSFVFHLLVFIDGQPLRTRLPSRQTLVHSPLCAPPSIDADTPILIIAHIRLTSSYFSHFLVSLYQLPSHPSFSSRYLIVFHCFLAVAIPAPLSYLSLQTPHTPRKWSRCHIFLRPFIYILLSIIPISYHPWYFHMPFVWKRLYPWAACSRRVQ